MDYPIFKFTHGLNTGAMAKEYTVQRTMELAQVLIHADAAISETIQVKRVSEAGATYTFILDSTTTSSATNYVFRPTGRCVFQKGDKLQISCTAATATALLTGLADFLIPR